MESLKVFESIQPIKIESPVDNIIKQIRALISSGQLNPGDRLPAERILAERFGIGRGYVREAIMKLEFYGLLKTSPQSGTYVAGLSLKILDSIFSDIISFNKGDFASMIEARYYLEINAASLAAERRNENDINMMREALSEYDEKAKKSQSVVQEDMLFHIKLASATKNSVIESMLLIIVPDLMKVITDNNINETKRSKSSIKEHHNILDAIIEKDTVAAAEAMKKHLQALMNNRKTFTSNN